MTLTRFWMVCRAPTHPGSRTEPRHRYTAISEARDAAAKLAAEQDARFVVLGVVEVINPRSDTPRLL